MIKKSRHAVCRSFLKDDCMVYFLNKFLENAKETTPPSTPSKKKKKKVSSNVIKFLGLDSCEIGKWTYLTHISTGSALA